MTDLKINGQKKSERNIIILIFIQHYLPGFKFGGPIRTIANMIDWLGEEFEFRIITSDRDFHEFEPYGNIIFDQWSIQGKSWVYYVSPIHRGVFLWSRLMHQTRCDVLYLNSLFSPLFTLAPLIVARFHNISPLIVIAPRGELSQGALKLKRWKKFSFLALSKFFGVYRDVLWHASTADEAVLIRKCFGNKARIVIARDMPPPVVPNVQLHQPNAKQPPDMLSVVFLSRISRMKNLDYALRVLFRLNSPIRFDIWGTKEDIEYWEECQKLIRLMPPHIEIRYRGVAEHSKVMEIVAGYDLFFLPTRGENYGHVIAESLSAGTPVLLSDRTPWRELSAEGVGWDLPLEKNEEAFVQTIETMIGMGADKRMDQRNRVYDYAKKQLTDPNVLEANRQLFLQAIAPLER